MSTIIENKTLNEKVHISGHEEKEEFFNNFLLKLLTKRRVGTIRNWTIVALHDRFAGRVLIMKFPNDRIYDFLAIARDPYVRED